MSKKVSEATKSFRRKAAYEMYLYVFNEYKKKKDTYWIRIIECSVNEAGLNGEKTHLISVEALKTRIRKAKKQTIHYLDNVSLEHPITYRVIARHALERKTPMSYEDYISLWVDNLVTTLVTSRQNKELMKYQKDFVFGVDCWKQMYKKAKIKLVENPDLRNDRVRIKYGLGKMNRGRKKK